MANAVINSQIAVSSFQGLDASVGFRIHYGLDTWIAGIRDHMPKTTIQNDQWKTIGECITGTGHKQNPQYDYSPYAVSQCSTSMPQHPVDIRPHLPDHHTCNGGNKMRWSVLLA